MFKSESKAQNLALGTLVKNLQFQVFLQNSGVWSKKLLLRGEERLGEVSMNNHLKKWKTFERFRVFNLKSKVFW